METNKITKKLLLVVFTTLLFLTFSASPSEAVSNYNYQTPVIQISSPSVHNVQFDRFFTFEGTSTLDQIWLFLRGPSGEITTYPVNVHKGKFSQEIWLRFGAGTYTVWVSDNAKKFDGKIQFKVQNSSRIDYFNLSPSGFVNSDNEEIEKIAASLTTKKMTDLEKVKAIYNWVTKNISYDTHAYYTGTIKMHTAIDTMHSKKGVCGDYSFLYAALARAAGVPTKVIYGEVYSSQLGNYEKHAWNESLIDGQWQSIDTTWDVGYPSPDAFKQTHKKTSVTLY